MREMKMMHLKTKRKKKMAKKKKMNLFLCFINLKYSKDNLSGFDQNLNMLLLIVS